VLRAGRWADPCYSPTLFRAVSSLCTPLGKWHLPGPPLSGNQGDLKGSAGSENLTTRLRLGCAAKAVIPPVALRCRLPATGHVHTEAPCGTSWQRRGKRGAHVLPSAAASFMQAPRKSVSKAKRASCSRGWGAVHKKSSGQSPAQQWRSCSAGAEQGGLQTCAHLFGRVAVR